MKHYFDGYYFKHQKDGQTLCIIVGCADGKMFIQVITGDFSAEIPLMKGNHFSRKGIRLNIQTPELSLTGVIRYRNLSPIKYDIMGPFRFFPMECRHGIISMYHHIDGKVRLNGDEIDFTDGVGYIEKDSGHSFPSSYVWVQANDFKELECSIMASVADIPFCGLHFRGCICVIWYQGREYRLATYLGARVLLCTKERILLKQGKYLLDIRVESQGARALSAPQNGKMTRMIREAAACPAEFRFYIEGKCVFHLYSKSAGFEYEF